MPWELTNSLPIMRPMSAWSYHPNWFNTENVFGAAFRHRFICIRLVSWGDPCPMQWKHVGILESYGRSISCTLLLILCWAFVVGIILVLKVINSSPPSRQHNVIQISASFVRYLWCFTRLRDHPFQGNIFRAVEEWKQHPCLWIQNSLTLKQFKHHSLKCMNLLHHIFVFL